MLFTVMCKKGAELVKISQLTIKRRSLLSKRGGGCRLLTGCESNSLSPSQELHSGPFLRLHEGKGNSAIFYDFVCVKQRENVSGCCFTLGG